MGKVLCIYHANCADGLGAAWAVQKALGDNVEFVAAKYGEEPPGVKRVANMAHEYNLSGLRGQDILIVDFSYPLATLRAMAKEARSVLVLDHHKTAEEDLSNVLPPSIWQNGTEVSPAAYKDWLDDTDAADQPLAAIFDLNRSGAGLTWDYLHPGTPRPRVIDLIEDRDLWQFKYGDESRAFHAVLASYDWSDLEGIFEWLDNWDDMSITDHIIATRWPRLLDEGRAILRAQQQAVRTAVKSSRRTIRIAGHVVPVANVPPSMASDAGHLLCEEVSALQTLDANQQDRQTYFSATYYDGADGKRHFNLRSPEGGADVGQIAKNIAASFNTRMQDGSGEQAIHILYHGTVWAGGGHAHSAGFDAPLGWEEQ